MKVIQILPLPTSSVLITDSRERKQRIFRYLTDSLTQRQTTRAVLRRVIIAELADREGYTWEQLTGRYRNNRTGQFVAESRIIAEVDTYHEKVVKPNIERITERLTNGNINVSQWQAQMQREIKDAHILSVQAGRGGKAVTTQADYGRQGGRLNFEYRRLDLFAAEIASKHGTDQELTAKQIMARSQLYSRGSRTAYYDGLNAAKEGAGFNEERRVLGATDHCQVCRDFEAEGWMPIGHFPSPGTQCEGRHNCGCDKEFRVRP